MTDSYQTWSSLAYGYMLTGDTLFLIRADQMSGDDLQGLQTRTTGFLENGSAMLALDQWITEQEQAQDQ